MCFVWCAMEKYSGTITCHFVRNVSTHFVSSRETNPVCRLNKPMPESTTLQGAYIQQWWRTIFYE